MARMHTGSQTMRAPLEGQLEVPENADVTKLTVVIVNSYSRTALASAPVGINGYFEVSSLPVGTYELEVRNLQGDVIEQTTVNVPNPTRLQIRIGKTGNAGRAAAPVSAHRLGHKVPKRAQQAVRNAMAKLEAKNRDAALAALGEALEQDPEFALAHSLLGAVRLEAREFPAAYEALHHALELDPQEGAALTNLPLVLLHLHRLTEAEEAARTCLRTNAANARARFYLALSLLEQGKDRKEATFHLTQAQADFPAAAKLLQQLKAE
ncbi:MAG: hypothetical protein NW208_18920 [Bryobacter sp.]|nr:hypothetical protein [Bryobacter sp.]